MSHYEERLEKDLGQIKEEIRRVAGEIETALKDATHALLTQDKKLAYEVILGDGRINRRVRKIDRLCHAFVVRHLPSAKHLRFVSSVLRLDRELERIGDYAVTICREAVQLHAPIPQSVARDIDMLSHQSRHVLRQSVKAFDASNADLAKGTKAMAVQVGQTFKNILDDLLREAERLQQKLQDLFAWQVVLNSLERVADRAKNVCEETVFVATGETKQPKVYRILFVDRQNNFRSLIAETYARKAFPDYGVYFSAGWEAADEIPEPVARFLDRNGHDLEQLRPQRLELTPDELAEFYVIVSLEEGVGEHIPAVPFHTVMLTWPPQPGEESSEETEEAVARAYQEISLKVRELFEALRGEEAV